MATSPDPSDAGDDLRPEYSFRSLRGVVRGKYAVRYRERLRVVRLADDVAAAFADEAAVNVALHEYIQGRASQTVQSKMTIPVSRLEVGDMNYDPFTAAGDQFRKKLIRNVGSKDQSIAALADLAKFCDAGVRSFYAGERPDVYVEKVGVTQVSIRFGYRPGKVHHVLTGPWATLFVTPEGKILWAALTRWVVPNTRDPQMEAEALDAADYHASITPKLIEFLEDAEREYQNTIA